MIVLRTMLSFMAILFIILLYNGIKTFNKRDGFTKRTKVIGISMTTAFCITCIISCYYLGGV